MAHPTANTLQWLKGDVFYMWLERDDTLRECFWNIIHEDLPQTPMISLLRMVVERAIDLNDWRALDAIQYLIVKNAMYLSDQIPRILDLAINNPGRYDWALRQFPNGTVISGRRVLVAAIAMPAHPSSFVILAQAGANDSNGRTVLMACVAYGLADTVERLLQAGCDPNEASSSGSTSLFYAVQGVPRAAQVLRVLIAAGANVNARERAGWTALHLAATGGCDECVEILLSAGADPHIQTHQGATPLQCAMCHGSRRCIELLQEAALRAA